MDIVKFWNIEKKTTFEEKLSNGEITSNCIVFIQETNEIWTYNQFYCVNVDGYEELEEKITNIQNIIDTEIGTSDAVKQSHVVLTQEEYDQRLENGTLLSDVFYYIPE